MLPDNIDDLFRQQLDGHATPPAPDLWARLQLPTADANPVDTTFREGLRGHATPPRRQLWERLEDEHLRPQPRRRRAVAWWQLSAAAVLLGLLLGGGLRWRGSFLGTPGGGLAQQRDGAARRQAKQPITGKTTTILTQPQPITQAPDLAVSTTPRPAAAEKKQRFFSTQATAPRLSTSSTPIATTTRPRRAATASRAVGKYQTQRQRPDATAGMLASQGRDAPGHQLSTALPVTSAPAVAPAAQPAKPTAALAVAAPTTTPEIIEVEVRRGPGPARPAAPAVAVATETPVAPARRRGLRLGSLLRQADHLVHGEPVSLAEATGLPETMTVQARLGGRLLSKTIQL